MKHQKVKPQSMKKRAGKVSRKGKEGRQYGSCLNVQNEDTGEINWLDFKRCVSEWQPVVEANDTEKVLLAIKATIEDEVLNAKFKELTNWQDNNVFSTVEDRGQSTISTRWVITTKNIEGNKIVKARLVIRGFEEEEVQNLTIPNDFKRKSANCNPIDREVIIKPPKEANVKGVLWKLNKVVYDLADASRAWYLRVKEQLIDDCCQGLIVIHVDDFLWEGSGDFQVKVIASIRKIFRVGSENCSNFKYVGVNIQQFDSSIEYDQSKYVASMEQVEIQSTKNKHQELSHEKQSKFRCICGQLNWVSSQSRPDISFDVCQLSTKLNRANVDDVMRANKLLKPPLQLILYADASFGNLHDGSSQSGIFVFLKGVENTMTPITWQSKKIKRVVRSTLAAETLALVNGIDAYNKSLYEAAYSTKALEDKRLRVDMASLRQSTNQKEVILKWIPTKHQLADVLTKQGANSTLLLNNSLLKHHLTLGVTQLRTQERIVFGNYLIKTRIVEGIGEKPISPQDHYTKRENCEDNLQICEMKNNCYVHIAASYF
ncbi:uncharacterized protein LOC130613486 [Hydractinia symbiolongicarpus]|uniref:uncharacterized protein LOC130613486 n=1 Tax=Hydractinia symbiolongicarpus TaxID=13093 RepID=UPI00254ED76B|nr:uncharacterized protein LOC130613486 [Hydractinia symbiolongicarpus]